MTSRTPFMRRRALRTSVLITALLGLSACADGQMPAWMQSAGAGNAENELVARGAGGAEVTTIERDVEAPDIFEAKEAGLWDGRPSLGGVWVAHPDVAEPERVLIRNETNGKYVIGALFKRERQSPGPRLQVSSDAAEEIGMLAGAPTNLTVVALRREEVETAPEPVLIDAAVDIEGQPLAPAETPEEVSRATTGEDIIAAPVVAGGILEPVASAEVPAPVEPAPRAETSLDPVAAQAAAALDAAMLGSSAPLAGAEVQTASLVRPEPKPAAKPARRALAKPFVQIGIFSVEQNARNTATAMRQAGMVPTVKKHQSNGKTFWRVVVGPAQTASEMKTLIGQIKAKGFTDAYAVGG